MKRDILTFSSLVHAESYAKVYLNNKEVGEINDESNTESEKQLNKLIEELVKTFKKFDHATEAFSAKKYSTILIIYPIIKLLKFEFAINLNPPLLLSSESNIDSDSEDEEDYTQDIFNIQLTIAQVKSKAQENAPLV
ncbi:15474_t:CDS:2 [Cetraspora pellucida]|uniref:15474_t:CDS:1 n=1 Tax=Cetraspora pellucida TaxID=1433469 RepID=A0A9N9NKE2_9GLOM|nr:15474_t:CDS:2 [Cetraspora pellucida]